jgi:hypothetical protein
VGSPGFWLALAALALVAVGLRLATSDSGQAFLVRYTRARVFLPQLATRLDVALANRFLEMGLLRGDLRARQITENGRQVREYRFASPRHLTPTLCNLEVARAARGVGAQVLRAEEHHERGEELVVWLGFGPYVTHRLVVLPPSAAPAVTTRRGGVPRLALVVDDFGNNMNATTRGFLDLGVPITVAVLPDLSKSRAAFDAAQERGIPALLHLPMEPEGGGNPGKNPVKVGMSPAVIDALIETHHRHYPTFVGVNNHMGSRATADAATMRALAQALRRQDLVFVDSETTPRTRGPAASREAGVWCLRNDLFLDDQAQGRAVVEANLMRLVALARKRGLAVGIAHPHPETLQALRALLPRLQADGIQFVTVNDLRPQAQVASEPAAQAAGRAPAGPTAR